MPATYCIPLPTPEVTETVSDPSPARLNSRLHDSAVRGKPRLVSDCSKPRQRISWLGLSWLLGCLFFAGLIAWNSATSSAVPTPTAAPITKPIETVRVGERALVNAPDASLAADNNSPSNLDSEEIVPSQWRLIRMQAIDVWPDGTVDDINIETLQRQDWIRQYHIKQGGTCPIPLDLTEMGLPETLTAKVLAIDPCPPLEDGSGRVVMTTVNHLNNVVMELTLENEHGQTETLRPTAPHKFYSVTRDAWLSASDLRSGEVLNGNQGQIRVIDARHMPGVHRVYNMTVQGEHFYRVANCGVLVHNNECFDDAPDGLGHPGSMPTAPRGARDAVLLADDVEYKTLYRGLTSGQKSRIVDDGVGYHPDDWFPTPGRDNYKIPGPDFATESLVARDYVWRGGGAHVVKVPRGTWNDLVRKGLIVDDPNMVGGGAVTIRSEALKRFNSESIFQHMDVDSVAFFETFLK